MKCRVNQLA